MTGYIKISAIDLAETEQVMPRASGMQVETRIKLATTADRISIVLSVMQALEFDDKDRALLGLLMLDRDGHLHKSMTVTMPLTGEAET